MSLVLSIRRKSLPIMVAAGIFVGLGGLVAFTDSLFAEQGNSFPNVLNPEPANPPPNQNNTGALWSLPNSSPSPGLFWLYRDDGINNGVFEHMVKNEFSSDIRLTKLRVYFRTKPTQANVVVNQTDCKFSSNDSGGRLTMNVGLNPSDYPGKAFQQVYHQYAFGRLEKIGGDKYFNGPKDTNPGPGGTEYPDYRYNPANDVGNFRPGNSEACSDALPAYNYQLQKWRWDSDDDKYKKVAAPNDIANETEPAIGGNRLDGSYNVPLNDTYLKWDPNSQLWFTDIEIDLSGARFNHTMMNQIRYNVSVSNADHVGYSKSSDTNGEKQFGVSADIDTTDAFWRRGAKVALPFAMACNDSGNKDTNGDGIFDAREATLSVYDVDNQGFGNVYMVVYERNPKTGEVQRLGMNRYFDLNSHVEKDNPSNRLKSNDANNRDTSLFRIDMKKGRQYMFIVINPYQVGRVINGRTIPNAPLGNVFSLRVPTDSIRGITDCFYDLTPTVQQSPAAGTQTTDDANFNVEGYVTKGAGVDADDHPWYLSVIRSSSRPANTAAAINNQAPCDWQANCSRLDSGIQTDGFSDPSTKLADEDYASADVPLGTWICFMMSVRKPTYESPSNQWSHSALSCNVYGREPRMQVWGHDVKVINSINTSTQLSGGDTRGSWGEYGVLSNLVNTNMASGNGLLNGAVGTQFGWSTLTFANTTLPQFGNYGGLTHPTVTEPNTESHANLSRGGVTYGANEEHIIQVAGRLTITDDLVYDDDKSGAGYDSITEIPRVIFIADEVVIEDDVRRIDPWIVANNITTCDDADVAGDHFPLFSDLGGFDLHGDMCNQSLKFNGPVIANSIYLTRTRVPSAGDDNPAETFNLRADAFLSSFVGGGDDTPVARTDNIYELPPRF